MGQNIKELRRENKELRRALEIERKRRADAEEFREKFKDLFSELLQDTFEYTHVLD